MTRGNIRYWPETYLAPASAQIASSMLAWSFQDETLAPTEWPEDDLFSEFVPQNLFTGDSTPSFKPPESQVSNCPSPVEAVNRLHSRPAFDTINFQLKLSVPTTLVEEPKFVEDWDSLLFFLEERADNPSSLSDKRLRVSSESKAEVAGADLDAVTGRDQYPGVTVCDPSSAGSILSSVDPFLDQTDIGRPRKCKCAYCRRRKIKCEGGYPCKECKKYGHQASCQPSTGESPPPTLQPKIHKTCDLCRRRRTKSTGGEPHGDVCEAGDLNCTWSQKRNTAKSQVAKKERRRAR
jgi:hypothetical protein